MATETEMGCGFMASLLHLKGFKSRDAVQFQYRKNKQLINPSKSAKPQSPPAKLPPENFGARKSSSSSKNSSHTKRPVNEPPPSASSELSLYRASTGNVMLLGHLGNLRKQGKISTSDKKCVVMGNVTKRPAQHQLGNILHSPVNRLNPDAVKSLGNEKYKLGKYDEALTLYDRAISIDPNEACYYSNKGAALIGLGRFVEAVFQCREAVRIDSTYRNAHYRLAKLYIRLGIAEKAVYHYKCSGRKASPEDIARAQDLENCLDKCFDAKDNGDWKKLHNESQSALSLGADSAPQIYAMKSEALMELHRHEEAYAVIQNTPHFNIELSADLLGCKSTAFILQVRALVYTANGRFDDAAGDVGRALRLDSSDIMKLTAERVNSVALARSSGNRLFKGSMFREALVAYNAGLEIDPYNSVLHCNRGACRFKLRQYEKAVEDCTAALLVRPCYSKARLRRANCYAQLEKWEAAIEDYEALMFEIPGDEEVSAALLEAKIELNKVHNGRNIDTDTISNLSSVSSDDDFKYFTTTPGLSVVLFCSKICSMKMVQLLEDVCLKFPSVNFLKVDSEDKSRIAKSEGVKVIPTFRIYRNGSQVMEIKHSFDRLESCLRSHCT